ncbi:MAG: sugar phosphate isomerase/epimerase [Bacteroidales bacterium]|nr:sugar phosphate isomerase/epimerase [Bacteroidales bacterium]
MNSITRRDFMKKSVLLASALPFINVGGKIMEMSNSNENFDNLDVSVFSKHLQFLDYTSLGEKVKEMGFSGVDLTVRAGGHVEPATVKVDLPKAVAEIKKGGSKVNMIATTIESVKNPLDVNVLETASACGIKYYRPAWYKYATGKALPESLEMYALQLKELSLLNKKLGIVGCYQNHAGNLVGGSLWEVYDILKLVDKQYFGAQYDIRHAMVEGANSWVNGLELIHPQIKTIVIKDFKWGIVNGKWDPINVPIGEGMVDFKKFFRMLKNYKIEVPVSMHCEYDLGGAEKGNRQISIEPQLVFDAMKKDLNKIQQLWHEA